MIYESAHHPVYSAQLAEAKAKADESFCTQSSEDFMIGAPKITGYVPAMKDATLLKLRNVEPHDDPWVGYEPHPFYPEVHGADWSMDGPKNRRAVFWLLHAPKPIHIMCGNHFRKLRRGDYVVFDDSKLHCVIADAKWIGAAWQIMEERYAKDFDR
jgi:hypothetical protein